MKKEFKRDKELIELSKRLNIDMEAYSLENEINVLNKIEMKYYNKSGLSIYDIKSKLSIAVGGLYDEILNFKSNKEVYLIDNKTLTNYIFGFKSIKEAWMVTGETYELEDVILVSKDLSFIIHHQEDNGVIYFSGDIEYIGSLNVI